MANNILLEDVMEELEALGVDAKYAPVEKYGEHFIGITVNNDSNINPVVCFEKVAEEFDNAMEIAKHIKKVFSENKVEQFDVNSTIFNKDYVVENLFARLEPKKDTDNYLTCDSIYEDIQSYLVIKVVLNGNEGATRVKEDMLEKIGMTKEEAFAIGYANSFKTTTIVPLYEVLGLPDALGNPLTMVTCNDSMYGAIAMCNIEAIKEYYRNKGMDYVQLVVIPSSVHEVLVVPDDDEVVDVEKYNFMIGQVNSSEVEDKDVLGTHCYVIRL